MFGSTFHIQNSTREVCVIHLLLCPLDVPYVCRGCVSGLYDRINLPKLSTAVANDVFVGICRLPRFFLTRAQDEYGAVVAAVRDGRTRGARLRAASTLVFDFWMVCRSWSKCPFPPKP